MVPFFEDVFEYTYYRKAKNIYVSALRFCFQETDLTFLKYLKIPNTTINISSKYF